MAQVDSLEVKITASMESADAAIQKLVTTLGTLDSALSNIKTNKLTAFGKKMDTLFQNMQKATGAANQFSDAMSSVSNQSMNLSTNIKSLPTSVNAFSSSVNASAKHVKSLSQIFGTLYANFFWVRRAFQAGLGAVEIASDLTEVQNVVDVTFGRMNYKLDEFAQNSRQTFGLSELSAKTYASQFQSMLSTMGVTANDVETVNARIANSANRSSELMSKGYNVVENDLSEMSLNLTKLAADMASFYNQESSDVAKRLQSGIISGQARALRQYGLDLTVATLQEYAMARGLDADVQSMTNAEKTMLRYEYVMDRMSYAQGDFARTANTWANQIKLLKQNMQALGAVVGGVFISAFKPAIQRVNAAMNTIIALVQKAANAIGKIMGWQIEISNVGVAMDEEFSGIGSGLDDAADGASGTADGLDKAAKKAKELKKTILGFDELNVLNGNNDSDSGDSGSGGSGGGAGSAIGGDGGAGSVFGGEAQLKKYESDISSWFELGRKISKTIEDALDSIDWDRIKKKADRIGINLASFLNGLITPSMFAKVSAAMAEAINTALHFLDSFGTYFDWKKFGKSIAAGINAFFEHFEFNTLAHSINVWAHGILDAILKALEKIDWKMIGDKIGKFLGSIDYAGILKKIARVIWTAFNGAFKAYSSMFDAAPIETAILTLVGITKLLKVDAIVGFTKKLSTATNVANVFFRSLSTNRSILTATGDAFPRLQSAIGTVQTAFLQFTLGMKDGVGVIGSLSGAFKTISMAMSPVAKGLTGIIAAVGEFMVFKNVAEDIYVGTDNIILKIGELAAAFAAAGVAFSLVFGFPAGLIAAGITAVIGAIAGVTTAMNNIVDEGVGKSIADALTNPGGIPLQDLTDNFRTQMESLSSGFDVFNEQAASMQNATHDIDTVRASIDNIKVSMDAGVLSVEEGATRLSDAFTNLANSIQIQMGYASMAVTSAFGEGGIAREAFESTGLDVDDMVQKSLSNFSEMGDRAIELANEINAALGSGASFDDPEVQRLMSDLYSLGDTSKDTEVIMGDLSQALQEHGVDFSEFVDEEGANVESFSGWLQELVGIVADTREGVEENFNKIGESIDQVGNEAESERFRESLPGALEYINGRTAEEAKPILEGIQRTMLQEIPDVMVEAKGKWEEAGGEAVTGLTEGEYVQKALTDYNTNVVKPFSDEISKAMEQLGIDGHAYAYDSAEEIISGLFDETGAIVNDSGYIEESKTTLSSGWQKILEEAGIEVKDSAKDAGFETVEGWNKGVDENISTSEKPLKSWFQSISDWWHDLWDSHSPSRVSEGWGKNVVEGFDNGIDNNTSISVESAKGWMLSVSKQLLGDVETMLSDMLTNVSTGLKDTADEAHSKVDGILQDVSDIFGRVASVTGEKFGEMSNIISDKIDTAKSVVKSGLDAISGFFSGLHLEFPQIKMPHFSMGTQQSSFLGQNVTLPSISVDWYANGGFPEDGLFFANHHELVGQFSNGKTAVANNEQIVAGIERGVTSAIVQYLPSIIESAVSAADTGGGDVYIGDEQIARAANRGNRKIDKRYNPAIQGI